MTTYSLYTIVTFRFVYIYPGMLNSVCRRRGRSVKWDYIHVDACILILTDVEV